MAEGSHTFYCRLNLRCNQVQLCSSYFLSISNVAKYRVVFPHPIFLYSFQIFLLHFYFCDCSFLRSDIFFGSNSRSWNIIFSIPFLSHPFRERIQYFFQYPPIWKRIRTIGILFFWLIFPHCYCCQGTSNSESHFLCIGIVYWVKYYPISYEI